MTIMLVTYDLKQPGRDYKPVHEYLKKFIYCKDLESVWLIETTLKTSDVRDGLKVLVDANDKLFVLQITKDADWSSKGFGCATWLNEAARKW